MSISQTRLRKLRELERRAKHRPCGCGCGELADECRTGSHPLAAFTIDAPTRAVDIHLDHEDDE